MRSFINDMSRFCHHRSLGLLLIRIATGLVFFMHGWQKIHSLAMVGGMMVGFGLPYSVGIFIAYLEVIGGLALILGIATRVLGVVFGIEMLVAILLTGIGRGYHAHELEIVLMLLSFGLALAGSGKYSFFKMECSDCGGMLCNGTDCPKNVHQK